MKCFYIYFFVFPSVKGKKGKKKKEEVKVTDEPQKPVEELELEDIYNVRQLEVLLRAYTIMAFATQKGAGEQHVTACVTAQTIVQRLLRVMIETSVPVAKEVAKAKAAEEKERAKSPKGGSKKEEQANPANEKPKRKCPIDFFPSTLDDWSYFEVPDDIIEVSNSEKLSPESVVSSVAIPQAALTFHWLEELEKLLKNVDLGHIGFPILCLENVLARTLFADKTLLALTHLKYEMLNYQLNLQQAATFHEKLRVFYGDIQIQLSDQAKWRLKITEDKLNAVNNDDEGDNEANAALAQRAALARRNLFLQKIDSQPNSLKILIDAAEIYLAREDYQTTRQFLWEAETMMRGLKEAQSFDELLPKCQYLKAQLAYRERRFKDVGDCIPSLERDDKDVSDETMVKAVILQSRALIESQQDYDKARNCVLSMQSFIARLRGVRHNQSHWFASLESMLEVQLAEIDFAVAKQNYLRTQHIQTDHLKLLADVSFVFTTKIPYFNNFFVYVFTEIV